MVLRFLPILAALILCGACSTIYREPVFDASPGDDTSFMGLIDNLRDDRPLDVLIVHGMCTHDAQWASDAVEDLYSWLHGDVNVVRLVPVEVPGTNVVLYQQSLPTEFGLLRVNALLWSPLTTPLKKQLCYDQSRKSAYCTSNDETAPYPYKRAQLNRLLKDSILDDCLSDAMTYQGRARDEISTQIQAAVLQAIATSGRGKPPSIYAAAAANAPLTVPLVVVTDSLGSKIAFDAIFKLSQGDGEIANAGTRTFDRISQIFMSANQLPILALADQHLDGKSGRTRDATAYPDDPIGELMRARAARASHGQSPTAPAVVAFTDPNDLLSYILAPSPHRAKQAYAVVDAVSSNDVTYAGVVELPNTAHLGYGENIEIQRLIACGNPTSRRCTKAAALSDR